MIENAKRNDKFDARRKVYELEMGCFKGFFARITDLLGGVEMGGVDHDEIFARISSRNTRHFQRSREWYQEMIDRLTGLRTQMFKDLERRRLNSEHATLQQRIDQCNKSRAAKLMSELSNGKAYEAIEELKLADTITIDDVAAFCKARPGEKVDPFRFKLHIFPNGFGRDESAGFVQFHVKLSQFPSDIKYVVIFIKRYFPFHTNSILDQTIETARV